MSSTTTIGSCLCSRVKYTFTGEPAKQAICHCNTCHKISGSAYTTNLIIPSTSFKITSGSNVLKDFSTAHETGITITIHFCGNCGSTVYKEGDSEMFRGTVIVQAGTLDGVGVGDSGDGESSGMMMMGFDDFKPVVELWTKRRVKWLSSGALDGIAQVQEFS